MMQSDPLQTLNKVLRPNPPFVLSNLAKDGVFSEVTDLAFYEALPQLVEYGMGVPLISSPGHQGVYLLVRLVSFQMNLAIYVGSENPLAFLNSLKERIVKARGIHDLRQTGN